MIDRQITPEAPLGTAAGDYRGAERLSLAGADVARGRRMPYKHPSSRLNRVILRPGAGGVDGRFDGSTGGFVSLSGLGIKWWATGVGMAVWARKAADSTLDPEDIVVL